jgi:FtsZ-binding cell division protein ZapB
LEILKNEKRTLTKELAELQTRLNQLESDKGNLSRLQDQWKREKQALIKRIELVGFSRIGVFVWQ